MEDKISETERVRLQTDDEWLEEYNTGKKVYPKKRYPKAVRRTKLVNEDEIAQF